MKRKKSLFNPQFYSHDHCLSFFKIYFFKREIQQRNWVFATNSVFVKPISLQPDDVNLWYFKLTLFDLIAFLVWNVNGLRHWVATILKLENQSLWQKLNSFVWTIMWNYLIIYFHFTNKLEFLFELKPWKNFFYHIGWKN